jgi:hypothetical protein
VSIDLGWSAKDALVTEPEDETVRSTTISEHSTLINPPVLRWSNSVRLTAQIEVATTGN